ncbi:hypothetical protein [Pontibacter sp. HSC-36F09]|uniref:hypothetical protein n=1 Tax=Pontibacter sp. HSC-36F09 TaxID=2910966 RepID=UPI00209E96DE|nr:hypothetical protein [Pontibacter sp. HSC-36F09]MCP2045534.1 hypothetical protein [Pontibacter sp. HSC-36F09]
MKQEENSLYEDFENLVSKILKRNKFKVEEPANSQFDFLSTFENEIFYIEAKLYHSKFPRIDLLRTACYKLSSFKDRDNIRLVLIVSSLITPSLKQELYSETGVTVWDIKELFALSIDFAELFYDLQNIVSRAWRAPLDDITIVDNNFKETIIFNAIFSETAIKAQQRPSKGKQLCKELNEIKPGKTEASKYENKCIEILKYLFDKKTDLTLWEKQLTTDDGLNRYDLLCRIISFQNNFWAELSNDFHARYIVFEFKNYTDKIKQGQILTTEKYLYLTALRSISFIIARNGADENAIKTAKGSLKEAGKLIVILDNKDICEMLDIRDSGDEPTKFLRRKIDDMLVTLNR